jgi:hypothetical protein
MLMMIYSLRHDLTDIKILIWGVCLCVVLVCGFLSIIDLVSHKPVDKVSTKAWSFTVDFMLRKCALVVLLAMFGIMMM